MLNSGRQVRAALNALQNAVADTLHLAVIECPRKDTASVAQHSTGTASSIRR